MPYYLIVEKLLVSTWFIGQICRRSPWVIFKEGWLLNEPTSFSYEIPTVHEAHFSGRFRNRKRPMFQTHLYLMSNVLVSSFWKAKTMTTAL